MQEIVKKNNAFFRQLLFLLILIVMGAVMVRQLAFFLGSFLGAVTFYIVFRKPVFALIERHRWPSWLSALVVVLGICVVLVGLGYLVFVLFAGEVRNVDVSQFPVIAHEALPELNRMLGFEVIPADVVKASTGFLSKAASAILNTTYSFAANIFMTILILYFMLTHACRLEGVVGKYIPFAGESREQLTSEITSIIYSNAVGIPLMMLIQGLVAALVYWLFGVPNLIFWAFMTSLCGLIPMVGTIIVSVPLGVWLIAAGNMWGGVALMLCGVLVIANADNGARIVLNKKISNTHPLIVIFGVILGIPLFGFWGIIFGPLTISVFLLLIRIYYREYGLLKKRSDD